MGVVLTYESEIRNDLIIGCCYPLVEDGASGCACILWVEWNDEELAEADEVARRIVRELFEVFMDDPSIVPPEWRMGDAGSAEFAEGVADYIAGMTDRFAMQEYDRVLRMDVLA